MHSLDTLIALKIPQLDSHIGWTWHCSTDKQRQLWAGILVISHWQNTSHNVVIVKVKLQWATGSSGNGTVNLYRELAYSADFHFAFSLRYHMLLLVSFETRIDWILCSSPCNQQRRRWVASLLLYLLKDTLHRTCDVAKLRHCNFYWFCRVSTFYH